jgi:hypothetical protein
MKDIFKWKAPPDNRRKDESDITSAVSEPVIHFRQFAQLLIRINIYFDSPLGALLYFRCPRFDEVPETMMHGGEMGCKFKSDGFGLCR